MKKIVSFMLSFVMALTLTLPAFAVDCSVFEPTSDSSFEVSLDNLDDCKELDFETVIAQDMEYYDISYETARNRLLAREAKILAEYYGEAYTLASLSPKNVHSDVVQYYTFEKEFQYDKNSKFKGLMQARIVILSDYGVHKVIEGVDWIITRATAGVHVYSWVEGAAVHSIHADKKGVRIEIAGYFEVEGSASIGGDADMKGFGSVGASVSGNVKYQSDTIIKNWTYGVG